MAKRSAQNNYSVYKHTSPSGKVYVGITSLKVQKRWNKGREYLSNIYIKKECNYDTKEGK